MTTKDEILINQIKRYQANMDKKEAQAKIAEKLKEAETALKEAAEIATEADVDFSWSGPAYGMGGWFDPKGDDEWSESGWQASSQSC